MNGFLLIDKPAGLSSFDVVRRVRRRCRLRRVGHAGTLDPFATGVLPVALGQATRLIEYLVAGDKEYVATMRLGEITDTQDLDGQVVARAAWEDISRSEIERQTADFLGIIHQVPPMYSAIKRNGQPLYKLARQGIEVERQPRRVRIDAIEVLDFCPPEVVLRVQCGKGTYIRTLCHDLGQKLGCGAHLVALRRTRCAAFSAANCQSLDQFESGPSEEACPGIIPPARALADWPALRVSETALGRLANGIAPRLAEIEGGPIPPPGSHVRLLAGTELAAVARRSAEALGEDQEKLEILKVFPDVISC